MLLRFIHTPLSISNANFKEFEYHHQFISALCDRNGLRILEYVTNPSAKIKC